jgi:hypothetical protein
VLCLVPHWPGASKAIDSEEEVLSGPLAGLLLFRPPVLLFVLVSPRGFVFRGFPRGLPCD